MFILSFFTFEQTHLANGVTPEGIAIVTALPVVDRVVAALPTADFPRRVLAQWLVAPARVVTFAVTHFSFAAGSTQARLDQAHAVNALIDAQWPPVAFGVLVGDLNADPTEPAIGAILDAGFVDAFATRNGSAPGFTFTTTSPTRRIDYVFVRGLAVDAASVELDAPLDAGLYASDHRAVAATLSR